MKRSNGLAYIIGAGIAGTILFIPYIGIAFWKTYIPSLRDTYVPIFLLPLIWGFWNWLYIRLYRPMGVGAWGALLGLIIGLSAMLLFYSQGHWFPIAGFLPVFAPAVYYLLWEIIMAPLNQGLGVYE